MERQTTPHLPEWVPEGARRYLAHTEAGQPIRDLARGAGCHASTVLRQIRRVEMRRDDPLVDAALTALAATHYSPVRGRAGTGSGAGRSPKDQPVMSTSAPKPDLGPTPGPDADTDSGQLARDSLQILRRLCDSGAVLAVAEEMEKAVVVRDDGAGAGARTVVVDSHVAQALALKDWISCANPGRVSRYRITAAGRAALGRMLAEAENRARAGAEAGFAEAQAPFAPGHRSPDGAARAGAGTGDRPRRVRYCQAESPLILLARRRDRDGKPFLDDALVQAGERLREDFELAQTGPRVTQNWDRFLTGGGTGPAPGTGSGDAAAAARDRVAAALGDLGPGLSDVALRCCCHLEGLEQAERRMGWSARSGKIVLRIALQRLRRHYDARSGTERMIG